MRNILVSLLLLMTFSVSGQKVSFSQNIVNSKDEKVIEIRGLWESYIQDCVKGVFKKDKTLTSKYWNDEELKNGFSNIAMFQVLLDFPVCLLGETVTFDITKMNNGFYRIKSLILQSDSLCKSVPAILNIYAKQKNSGFKFYSHFYLAKSKLSHFSTENIEYFYPSGFAFDKKKAKKADTYFAHLKNEFKFQPKNKIKYIVAESIDEANTYLGFDYSLRSSVSKNAGYFLAEQNIIVSCQVDHYHEIVHSVFMTKYPNAPALFQEGIATYFGGTGGNNFDFQIAQLCEMIESNPNTDLSKFNDLNKLLENGSNHFNTIGAIFIDYAFKKGGSEKVIALFQHPDSEGRILLAITKELEIEKNDVGAFLKNYIIELNKEKN